MVYTANWGIICHLPPFRGTRNNHWISGSPSRERTNISLLVGDIVGFRECIPPGKDRWRNATPISLSLSWLLILELLVIYFHYVYTPPEISHFAGELIPKKISHDWSRRYTFQGPNFLVPSIHVKFRGCTSLVPIQKCSHVFLQKNCCYPKTNSS